MCCICVATMLCIYCFFTPSLSSSPDDRCRCPCDRLRRRRPYPYYRATRQAEPLPLSHISPICLYLSIALGICCCYVTFLFKCIACHCRHLLYLSYILCSLINIYYILQ